MKCLLVRQPYASLIAYGQKRIEFRNYKSHFTGKIMIAASRGEPFKTTDNKLNLASKSFPRGKILSTATLEKVELFKNRDLLNRINGYDDIIIHGSPITTVANPLGEPINDVFSAINDEKWVKYAWFLNDIEPLDEPVVLVTRGFGPWINLSDEESEMISRS